MGDPQEKLWTYKGARSKYPVERGDTWRVGQHTFVCGDLVGDRSVLMGRLAEAKPDFVYTDPPWNDRIATEFRYRSGADAEKKRVDSKALITSMLMLVRELKTVVLMEGGHKMREMNRQAIADAGGVIGDEWTITYTDRALPCALWVIDFRDNPSRDWPSFEGLNEIQSEDLAMKHYAPRMVFDPFCGLGGTPSAANAFGCASLGHELSPFKLAEAIKRLVQESGQPASKI